VPTLFEPFQGKPQGAARSAGLGLGLFIARQIAAAHGGDLAVESSDGAGTLVTVRLPRDAHGGTIDLGRPARSSGDDEARREAMPG
jgi:signal transduction histidine kinase